MIFICKNCNQRMKSDDVTGNNNGTLSLSTFCPECGSRFVLLANQGETLLLKSLNAGQAGERLMSNLLDLANSTLPCVVRRPSINESPASSDWQKMKNEWVWIEPGKFVMGSSHSEAGRETDETPHEVEITRGFFFSKYVITRGHWEEIMGTTPWRTKDRTPSISTLPAVYISWNDMQCFLARLNEFENDFVYRLPTEAEWEYACRAGTISQWSFGENRHSLGDYACYIESESIGENQSACEVGTKLANPWGLYDMHGNVWEWCQDVYGHGYYSESPAVDPKGPGSIDGAARVTRGGYYQYFTRHSRSASRNARYPNVRHRAIGARLVRLENS